MRNKSPSNADVACQDLTPPAPLNADPRTAAVYVDFKISYGCAATEAGDCKAMAGFCIGVFRLRFVGGQPHTARECRLQQTWRP